MQKNSKKILILFFILISFSITVSKEVAKFAYRGKPEDFHQKTMTVPSLMVALSDYQYAHGKKFTSGDTICQPSIMLIIDYSASMLDNDPDNKRVTIPTEVLESIYQQCPQAEVGISLFSGHLQFDREDDPYSVTCPSEPGRYCPLLQLNKQYPPNNMTGYEILQWYLKMRDVFLDYLPFNNVNLDGTHIRAGINATKHAFESSNRVKDVHFNLFFSDGEPKDPEGDLFGFVPGKNVATTFTVFFGETIPQCLTDFTNNVKANGYSSNNGKTDLWKIKDINNDTLVNFVLKNIITNILTGGYMMPNEMAVNGGTPVNNWYLDSTGFQFPTLFPLLGKVTDFTFDLNYKIRRIKKNTQTGQIDTIDTDTTHYIDFNVDIDAAQGELPDSTWDVRRWDRNLGFYFNGSKVDMIEDHMDPLDIQFDYDPREAKYNYTKASVEISNTSSNGTDIELVDLNKNGLIFSGSIKRTVIANSDKPTPNDGILQHYKSDNITAVFRNDEIPKLGLDTLKITVPFEFSGGVMIQKAFYFDNSADGYVDSIFVETKTSISGGLTNGHVREIVDKALTLPSFRDFSVTDYDVIGNNFYLLVREDKTHNPFTYITFDDILECKSYNFTTGGMLVACDIIPIDRIAPLIHWQERSALLADYQTSSSKDTLGVKFSEPVKLVDADEPFYFLETSTNNPYSVTLKNIEQPKSDSMVFEVVSVSGVTSMKDGDSLWIRETDRVVDTLGNAQNNNKNSKRRLYVEKIKGSISVNDAMYFDNNADGFVDSMYIRAATNIDGGFTKAMIDELVNKALVLPDFRKLAKNSSDLLSPDEFYIKVTETANNPTTYVTQEDILNVKQMVLSDGGKVLPKKINIKDKIAPVILWEDTSACLYSHFDDSPDTLEVKFSEEIKNLDPLIYQPFYFLNTAKNRQYQVELEYLNKVNEQTAIFKVLTISGVTDITEGDSLWIKEKDNVTDMQDNSQNNENNIKRKIFIIRRLPNYNIIAKVVSPVRLTDNSGRIHDDIISFYSSIGMLEDLELIDDSEGKKKGVVLTAEIDPKEIADFIPDFKMESRVMIFDAIGNLILTEKPMQWWDEENMLIHVWNVKNTNRRTVGSQSYVVMFKIKIFDQENTSGREYIKTRIIGVKE